VLKKAGIIVAVAATGVLAVSSLAFADTESGNLSNDCSFPNTGGDVSQTAEGGSSPVAGVGAVIAAAVNLTSQVDSLNCNNVNVEDVLDSNSNNKDSRTEKNMIEDSFNTED
jgi:hypothetical protein